MNHQETLILGIGNSLLSDEGAGIHAMNHLKSACANIPGLTFLDGGTLSFTLVAWIEDCTNLIVLDAAEMNQPAGTVQSYVGAEMDAFLGEAKRSAHEIGLLDMIDIARITEHLPENRAIIGIQPEYMGWGVEPTATVQAALKTAANEAMKLIRTWQAIDAGKGVIEAQ
jgi:hydrogenase maturation protease